MTTLQRVKTGLDVAGSVALTVAGIALTWTLVQQRRPAERTVAPAQHVDNVRLSGASVRHVKGTARLAIVEFSDYECPYCGAYARDMAPQVEQDLIASGQVSYVFMHFPLEAIHPRAMKASEAAECAGRQEKYWEMHERLFRVAGALAPTDLLRHAETIGLDTRMFETCLNDETSALVRADIAEGRRLGVQATPTFFLAVRQPDGSFELRKRFTGVSNVERFKSELAGLSLTTQNSQEEE